MLHASKPLTSGKVQSYYRSEYSSASNSYFSQGGTLRGEWHGQLTGALSLSGAVSAAAFDRLADGQHPETGEQLIKHRDTIKTQTGEEVGHRAGWDLTFNAPKTVSLTALVGGDERVRLAHQTAVRSALDATEGYVQARMGGNHAAENTGKWIAATFEHDTARPVDGYPAPHLHTHVIVFNMTEDAQGQARSLQPYELFRIQSMATAIYQNKLESQLRQTGYGIERGTNHAPDIKGYTKEYIEAESLRTAEIKRVMEERGVTGREAENEIKHQNRENKLLVTPEELKAIHLQHAEEFGHQPARVMEQASQSKPKTISQEKADERATAAITFARNRLSERSSVFEHFEVVRDALRHTQGRVGLQAIENEIVVQKLAGAFLEVQHIRPNAPAFRYTTPELIQYERESIAKVLAGKGSVAPAVPAIAIVLPESLNDDQKRLVTDAVQTRDQIFGIQGRAGTGKTTALRSIRELVEALGFKTHGLGPTSRAAKGLKEAGVDAETLQMYLTRPTDRTLDRPTVFFVDESSLASSKAMRDFLLSIRPEDRVLLIGDTRQHQSIEAGRIFEQLQDASMTVAMLDKIVRQKDEGLRQAVEALAAGKIADGVGLFSSQGRISSVAHRGERFQAIAEAYAAAPEGTLVVSPDNQSRHELNAAIRAELRTSGHLQEDAYELPILRPRQDLTAEDRRQASSYRLGDSVRYVKGSDSLGLKAKSYANVIATNPEDNLVTVRRAAGKFVTYDPSRLSGVAIFESEIRTFAVGDRIQFTSPWRDKGISTRDTGTISYLDKDGNVRIQLDDSNKTIDWNFKQNRHVDYAYAMTSHSSQGATVDRVLVQIDTTDTTIRALIDQTLAYVALSRPRYDAQIFTDDEQRLSAALSRTNQNATALAPEQTTVHALSS